MKHPRDLKLGDLVGHVDNGLQLHSDDFVGPLSIDALIACPVSHGYFFLDKNVPERYVNGHIVVFDDEIIHTQVGENTVYLITCAYSSEDVRFGLLRVKCVVKPILTEQSYLVLDLPLRARKALVRLNIQTVGELTQLSAIELTKNRNFGTATLAIVRRQLAKHGLTLRDEPPVTPAR